MGGNTASWRDRLRPIIADVIAEVGTDDMKRLRKALRERWDFGPREYHPYKVWLDEIRVQLGLKRPKANAAAGPPEPTPLFDEQRCRVCGCTDLDCSGCIERTGQPCYWVEEDLCSACAERQNDRSDRYPTGILRLS